MPKGWNINSRALYFFPLIRIHLINILARTPVVGIIPVVGTLVVGALATAATTGVIAVAATEIPIARNLIQVLDLAVFLVSGFLLKRVLRPAQLLGLPLLSGLGRRLLGLLQFHGPLHPARIQPLHGLVPYSSIQTTYRFIRPASIVTTASNPFGFWTRLLIHLYPN